MPKELDFIGIYMPPALIVGALAFFAALCTAMLLNRLRLSRFIAAPPVAFLGFVAIYAALIDAFLIPA